MPLHRLGRLVSAVDELLAGATSSAAAERAATGEPERDRYGRYLIPVDGKKVAFSRATTVAKTLSDTYALEQWSMRLVAKGLALRPDLFARAAATPLDDKRTLDAICEDAKEAAGASSGRNQGTALHTFTEQVDAGQDVKIPAPWDADVAAYRAELMRAGVRIVPGMIEKVVCLEKLRVAGTFDRLVTLRRFFRLPLIADLKTGGLYDPQAMAMQLAMYAHADFIYDYATGERSEMPEVDRTTGLIFHLPPGQATCTIHRLDLEAGWEAVERAMWTRKYRSAPVIEALAVLEAQAGGEPVPEPEVDGAARAELEATPVEVPAELIAETNQVLRNRLRAAVETGARNVTWPAGVRKFPDGGPETWEHVLAAEAVISAAEAEVGAPFLAPLPKDPTAPAPVVEPLVPIDQLEDREPPRPPIPAEDLERLRALNDQLPEDLKAAALDQVAANGVPTDRRQWCIDHLETIEHVLIHAAEVHARRMEHTKQLLAGTEPALTRGVLRLLDVEIVEDALARLTSHQLERLDLVLRAVDCGALGAHIADDGGHHLVVNPAAAEVALLIAYGTKTDLVAAAKTAADTLGHTKPRSTAQVVEDPLLVAVLLAGFHDAQPNPSN